MRDMSPVQLTPEQQTVVTAIVAYLEQMAREHDADCINGIGEVLADAYRLAAVEIDRGDYRAQLEQLARGGQP